jgi:general stress protein YciG
MKQPDSFDQLRAAAAALGQKGGAAGTGASKRRDVDYAALGRKGGQAGKGKPKPRK